MVSYRDVDSRADAVPCLRCPFDREQSGVTRVESPRGRCGQANAPGGQRLEGIPGLSDGGATASLAGEPMWGTSGERSPLRTRAGFSAPGETGPFGRAGVP